MTHIIHGVTSGNVLEKYRFCIYGTGRGGWMDVSVLSYEKPLVGAGWTISLVLNTNGLVLLVTIA